MRRKRVLVVEDDRAVREVVTLCLAEHYAVSVAGTGVEALRILRREPVAAMVLDYRLPDRNGLDVLAEIRSDQPALPIIMMTGYGSEGLCAAALRLGIHDYFAKPLNVFDLRQSLRRILSGDGKAGDGKSGAQARELRGPREAARPQPDLAIQKAALLIQQRYWDRLTLSGLAGQVGMSKYRLSRRFKEVMGITLRAYTLKQRLDKARDILAAGHTSVTEVALAVGFGDLPRFDKVFKRYTGVTPSTYRDRAGQDEMIRDRLGEE